MRAFLSLGDFLKSSTTRLVQDRAGGVAIIMGLLLIPLVGAVGLAVDSARAYSVKMRLQEAIDAAALVGGRNYTDSDRDQQIESYFLANWKANFQSTGVPPTLANGRLIITTNEENREVKVSAKVTMPTMIIQVLPGAPNSVNIENEGAAVKGDTKLEVAIALDNTTSMVLRTDGTVPANDSERRLEGMKDAAKNFVNLLYTDDKGNVVEKVDNMWVSLVPFTSMVNVGPKNTQFLVPGMINKIQWDLPAAKGGFGGGHDKWAGCVFERSLYSDGVAAVSYTGRDLTDDPPSVEKFQPYFVPPKGYEIFRDCPNICPASTPNCATTPPSPTTPTTPPPTPPCYKYFDGYAIPCSFNPQNLRESRKTLMRSVSLTAAQKDLFSAPLGNSRYLMLAGSATVPTLSFGPGPSAYPFVFNGISYTGFYTGVDACSVTDPYNAVDTTPGAIKTEYCLMGSDPSGNNDWRSKSYMCKNGMSEWCSNSVAYYLAFKRKLGGAIPLYGASADPTGPSTQSFGFLRGDAVYGTAIKDFCGFGKVSWGPKTPDSAYWLDAFWTNNTVAGFPNHISYQELGMKTMRGRWITPIKKGGKTIMSGWGNSGCGLPLVPLQEKRSTLIAKIDDMEVADLPPTGKISIPGGTPIDHPDNGYSGTLINEGLVWAWRTLSPLWRGTWKDENGKAIDSSLPLNYNEDGASKAIVIMTDGLNFLEDATWSGGALRSASIMDRTGGPSGLPTMYNDGGGWTHSGIWLSQAENPILTTNFGVDMNDVDSSAYGVIPNGDSWYYNHYKACMRRSVTPTSAPYNFDGYEDANTCSIVLPRLLTTARSAKTFKLSDGTTVAGWSAAGTGGLASASPGNMNTGPYYDELEYRLSKTCQNIRDNGVRIYFVLFAVNNTHPMKNRALGSFNDCVGNMGKVYDAVDTAELNAAFKDIAASIRQLRLSE